MSNDDNSIKEASLGRKIMGGIQNVTSYVAAATFLDAASVCLRFARAAAEARDTALMKGDITEARRQSGINDAHLMCAEELIRMSDEKSRSGGVP